MQYTKSAVAALLALYTSLSTAAPLGQRGLFDASDDISLLDNMLLLDAPGFRVGNDINANFKAYTFVRGTDNVPFASLITAGLDAFGLNVTDNSKQTLEDRAGLFLSIPTNSKSFSVKLDGGCTPANLGPTEDGGFLEQVRGLGPCTGNGPVKASVELGKLDSRNFTATVFASASDGFGIISDIDDTIKQSFVLDAKKAAQAAFLDEPAVVPGMPALFSKLNTDLSSPNALYVSGSPIQFYPFLQSFILENYIPGAINLKNFSFTDLPGIIDTLRDANSTFDFKVAQIDKIIGFYPEKKFVQIGDSTQKDPEVYAQIFKTNPESVQCIWIRKVDEADNSDARFAAAFEGVPAEKFKVFTDPSELMGLDVKNGVCN